MSLSGFTWQCCLKYTGNKLQTFQDQGMILFFESNNRGGTSSVMGDRYVKSDENRNILYICSNNLYRHSMSQPLPYDETKFDKNVELEDILITPDDSDIGYLIEVALKYPYNLKDNTKNFPFAPENEKKISENLTSYMNKNKPNTYTQN